MQAAMSTGVAATYPAASPCTKMTRSATPSSAARSRAAPMKTVLMSTPVPVMPWSRAQRAQHLPAAAGQVEHAHAGCSPMARPSMASFSAVKGLWMRWSRSRMVKLRGRSTSSAPHVDGADDDKANAA